jgi:hypothetical protein
MGMRKLFCIAPVKVVGSTPDGRDWQVLVYRAEEDGKRTLYSVFHGASMEEAQEAADSFVSQQKLAGRMMNTIRKAYLCMDDLNNGGFGPMTRKQDIDAMLELGDIIKEHGKQ